MQNKVSGVPEEDLRDNRHRGRKGSRVIEMPPLREDSQAGMADFYFLDGTELEIETEE